MAQRDSPRPRPGTRSRRRRRSCRPRARRRTSRPAASRCPRSPVLIRPSTTVLLLPSEYPPKTSPPPAKIRPVTPVGTARSSSSEDPDRAAETRPPDRPGRREQVGGGRDRRDADLARPIGIAQHRPELLDEPLGQRRAQRRRPGDHRPQRPQVVLGDRFGPRSSIRCNITGTATIAPARCRLDRRERLPRRRTGGPGPAASRGTARASS